MMSYVLSYVLYHLNTLTSMQHFYSISGTIPVGCLPGAVKGPCKAIRYYLGDQASTMGVKAATSSTSMLLETYNRLAHSLKHAAPTAFCNKEDGPIVYVV